VADYVVGELHMLGSMCLGRNYESMKLVEEDFPYENLVALITDERMPSELRSVAVHLMSCLYVDANPQVFEEIICVVAPMVIIKSFSTLHILRSRNMCLTIFVAGAISTTISQLFLLVQV
jgi:hypothetical protein